MDLAVLQAFSKYAQADGETPSDYFATRAAMCRRFPGLEKTAWSWHGFKEGLQDEGIPLTGATIGAGLGGLRGAALGYAAGGGVSMLRSKLKGEEPSFGRKLLAASALGYGAGGGVHALGDRLTRNARPGVLRTMFHGGGTQNAQRLKDLVEEGLPAAGATLATGITMARARPQERQAT